MQYAYNTGMSHPQGNRFERDKNSAPAHCLRPRTFLNALPWRAMAAGVFTGLALLVFSAGAVAAAESTLPLTIQSNRNTYTIKAFTVGTDAKGNTTITLSGSGFEIIPFVNGKAVVPVWCSFIAGGKEYMWQSARSGRTEVGFVFGSAKKPEKIILYAEDKRDKKYEFSYK